ncbi:50S ribosomal protein L29 [Candidatus Tisiphia endosymbiont of Beris chalybata]|uniref:50S ribosomal protein L29 n=1 Tax=Candidatus Tisiphia endosymbiont of Beris chalybata TaxID=3066262 RepID=UPI00312C6D0A
MNNSGVSPKELSAQSIDELIKKRIQYKKEFFNLRFQSTLGELKNTSRFAVVKKIIARINTELNIRIKTGE